MKSCRQCQHTVSEDAVACPSCGAPYPANPDWNGWGFEYKSKAILLGLPLLHVSFKYPPNKVPVVAKGVIAIGQFEIGLFSLSQFAIAYSCIAQFGIYNDFYGVGTPLPP
jgi:hypothetical protein